MSPDGVIEATAGPNLATYKYVRIGRVLFANFAYSASTVLQPALAHMMHKLIHLQVVSLGMHGPVLAALFDQ